MDRAPVPAIEFRVADFAPNDFMFDFVGQLLAEAAKMGVEPGDLRKLVVADDESYGPAIREFDPAAGYTHDGIYQGVGKIIAERVNGSFVGSNLVVHHSLLGCFAAQPGPGHPPGELEAFRYGFFHEMGHCVDNRRRLAQHMPSVTPRPRSHLRYCASHNSEALLAEYAACYFSATHLPPAGFAYLAKSTRGNLEKYLGAGAALRSRYRIGLATLNSVRDAALDAFWRGLIEHAKLAASIHGNPALGPRLPAWPDGSPEAAALLREFAAGLRAAWNHYPDCLTEFERITTDTWFALTASQGYVFEVRPEGDHLRFV